MQQGVGGDKGCEKDIRYYGANGHFRREKISQPNRLQGI